MRAALLLILWISQSPLVVLSAGAPLKPLTNHSLTKTDGSTLPLHDLKGKYLVLTVGDEKDFLYSLRSILDAWAAQPESTKQGFPLQGLLISVGEKSLPDAGENITVVRATPEVAAKLREELAEKSGHSIELLNPLLVPLASYGLSGLHPEEVLSKMRSSVAWWTWFFVISALMALPGLYLVVRLRKEA